MLRSNSFRHRTHSIGISFVLAALAATNVANALSPGANPDSKNLAFRAKTAVNFEFARSDRAGIDPNQVKALQDFVRLFLKDQGNYPIIRFDITGFSDPLNASDFPSVNLKISRRRAETVRTILVEIGVPKHLMVLAAAGARPSWVSVDRCNLVTEAKLRDCYSDERRVEIVMWTRPAGAIQGTRTK